MTSPRSLASYGFRVAAVAAVLLLPCSAEAVQITTSYLNETPLQGLNPVKPNIVFTVDDSGSMSQEYLPDFSMEGPINSVAYYCRDNNYCGGVYPPGFKFTITVFDPPARSSNQNKQYYDPSATYVAAPDPRSVAGTLPYESTSPGTWTSVYLSGYAGYPSPNNGGTINLVTGYPDTAWCNRLAASPPSALDLATATLDGSKCRLNGRAYVRAVGPAGEVTPSVEAGYNYPNRMDVATGAPTACSGVEYCDFTIPATIFGNPYYYTISKVQFCTSQDSLGFGRAPCQDRWDETTFRFVRYGSLATQSLDPKAFTRVDIVPATSSYPSGRTYAEEMANFAKWYTFYRDRISSIKTAGGLAFFTLTDENARVGFHVINDYPGRFVPVKLFDATQKTAWFTKFYGVVPNGGTPLPAAVRRIGEYFRSPGTSGLPDTTDPLDLNGPGPATGQCQANYHLLATDGYWNGAPAGTVGDTDKNVPSVLPGPIPGFTPNAQFPRPYYEGPTPTADTLADLAMYYWITDLRPTLPDKVNDTVAPWQHVTLFGVSQGAQGNIPYPDGLVQITGDPSQSPPILPTRDWPPATGVGGPEGVDDLWHAALNSRGDFATAQDSQQLANTMIGWITKITSQAGTGTNVGIAGAQFTSSRHFGYKTSYETGWWGDVKKYELDPNTGALPVDSTGNPANPAVWSAATQLDALAQGTGWKTSRRIVTINASNLAVPFRYDSLSPTQQDSLNAGWIAAGVTPAPNASSVLDFLRGDRSNEGVSVTSFRIRSHVLGDIVYSGAISVGAPSQPYVDASNPGYQAFATTSAAATRIPMVYVGANDGMVHAFMDSCPPALGPGDPPCTSPPNTTDPGKEAWAFVPKAFYTSGDPNDSSHGSDPAFQLGALAYNTRPLFSHRFYVNATARAWDVDFANTNTSTPPQSGNDWHTVLVGGLGAGGRSVYALDVTTPPSPTDTEASIISSKKVLWEFTDDNLGYTFDPPTLVKTYAYGWVALIPSGYNNKGGKGWLFVVNPKTGQLVNPTYGKIPLPAALDTGTDVSPTGLSTIRAYTPSRRDPYVLQAYGGDLKGNVWRFDLSDPNPANWASGVALIAKLKDGNNNEQPITTGVRIEIDQNNNVDRYLFVGTGKLLGVNRTLGIDDINSNTVRNSIYVIRDGTRTAAEAAPAVPYSRSNLNSVNGAAVSDVTTVANSRGWYQDAADLTEKIGTDVYADVQTVVFAFSKPTTDPCGAPLSSRLFARDLNTGNSVLIAPNGSVVPGYDIGSGIAGVGLIQGEPGASSSSSNGDVRALVTTMKGEVFSFGIKLAGAAAAKHRVSWRLLNRD